MTKSDDFSKTVDQEMGYIEFIQATVRDEDGKEKPHWYYVSIMPSKYEDFKAAQEQGSYDINDFGEVLYHGPGTEPSDEVKKTMEEAYGIRDDFEENLQEAVRQINNLRKPTHF